MLNVLTMEPNDLHSRFPDTLYAHLYKAPHFVLFT